MARLIFLSDPVVCSRGRLTLQYITEEPMEQKKALYHHRKAGNKVLLCMYQVAKHAILRRGS